MKTATGLTLLAIGAILAFAVTAHPRFLNLQVAGWVIILTGLVGLFVPRRGYGWLRRRVVVRRDGVVRRGARRRLASPAETSTSPADTGTSPYVVIEPGPPLEPGAPLVSDAEAGGAAVADGVPPQEYDTVEEYYEE